MDEPQTIEQTIGLAFRDYETDCDDSQRVAIFREYLRRFLRRRFAPYLNGPERERFERLWKTIFPRDLRGI